MTDWRNRIIEVKQISAADLRGNSRNWRTHPDAQQKAIRGLLGEVGIVAPLVAYHSQRANGALTLIDGHMRQETGGTWPCVVLDVTDAEADLVLATFDPISALAETDTAILDALLRDVSTGEAALQELLAEMAVDVGLVPPDDPMAHWQGMPEFEHEDLTSRYSINVHFANEEALQEFAELIGQSITTKTKSIWHPKQEIIRYGEAHES